MLIVYPTVGYNSFVTEIEADTIIGSFPSDNGYLALSATEKEALLINAFTYIRTCSGFSMPDTAEDDLKQAQSWIAAGSVGADPFADTSNSRSITKEKVDTLEVQYDPAYKSDGTDMLPIVSSLLKPYGCGNSPANSFKNVYIGRS